MSSLPYPPLASCVVVDSRFSYRKELIQKINGSQLFAALSEAGSCDDAINLVRYDERDACVIGASVSREKIPPFIKQATEGPCSAGCAFVIATPEGKKEHFEGVHRMVSWPCTVTVMRDSLVQAVFDASSGAEGDAAESRLLKLREAGYCYEPKAAESTISVLQAGIAKEANISSKATSSASTTVLDRFPALQTLERSFYVFRADGKPSATMERAVHEAATALVEPDADPKCLQYAIHALYRWLRERETMPRDRALSRLEKALAVINTGMADKI